jgi:formate dehydrogenase subunit delta
MSAHTTEKLVHMVNQIAKNVMHDPDPVAMIADHIHAFWSVRMKADVFAVLDGPEGAALDPVARAALQRLAAHAS